MGFGAFAEPLVVISLLVSGTLINRERGAISPSGNILCAEAKRDDSSWSLEDLSSPSGENGLLGSHQRVPSPSTLARERTQGWRRRDLRLFGWVWQIRSPDTRQFQERPLSRLLRRLPFLVEVWYWALIYWVYQLGRAFTAVTLVRGTVLTARQHALQVIEIEKRLGIFIEVPIQQYVMAFPVAVHWINRIYSFIHIPGTIVYLIWLYYYTVSSNRLPSMASISTQSSDTRSSPAGPAFYQARRRTMAMCNLIAFIAFTAWPCMPPRLLSDPAYTGPDALQAKGYQFVDTVHGAKGESSVWTQNKFCNQYAAMPSLHFGYSLLIGITIMTIPAPQQRRSTVRIGGISLRLPSTRRCICAALGLAYPAIILLAIVATANHFVLDAVAGAVVSAMAWKTNRFLLNLCPIEDWFSWCLRIHKPAIHAVETTDILESESKDVKSRSKGPLINWKGTA